MPSREEHTRHCKELYGYGFEEVHKWMDGTVKSRGPSHRVDRHDIDKTPEKAYKIFKDKVPNQYREFIRDAVKDHIEMDKRGGRIPSRKSEEEEEAAATLIVLGTLFVTFGGMFALNSLGVFEGLSFWWNALLILSLLIGSLIGMVFLARALGLVGKQSDMRSGEGQKLEKEKSYYCKGCGKRISKEEYERNEGFCDACTLDEAGIGGGLY